MMRSLKLQGRRLPLQRHCMLTWTEKGERLDAEMHSINPFSDASIGQVETLYRRRRIIGSSNFLVKPT